MTKRLLALFLATVMLFGMVVYAEEIVYKEIYVSETGDDSGSGDATSPFKTLKRAKEEVAKLAPDMTGDIVINIKDGFYPLDEKLVFRPEDSGRNGYKIVYRGVGEKMPVISGGYKISGFKQSAENPDIWETTVPDAYAVRGIYVNGKKGYMAENNRLIKGLADYKAEKSIYDYDGMYVSKADFCDLENPSDVELHWVLSWKDSICKVEDIFPDPDNEERLIVKMQNPYWNSRVKEGDGERSVKFNRPFAIRNAKEYLDKPGEFYFNRTTKVLSYIPREGEDMKTAEVVIPKLEQLVYMIGNSLDEKVGNITFENLQFAHSTWYAVTDSAGIRVQQAQMIYHSNDVPGHIEGAIFLDMTNEIHFKDSHFFGLETYGVNMDNGVSNTSIIGCVFNDLGTTAMTVGNVHQSDNDTGDGIGDIPEGDMLDLTTLTYAKVATSYNGLNMSNRQPIFPNFKSDPEAPQKGEKSWIRYDFGLPYTIDSIKLTFNDDIPSNQRKGFEVLLSNDKYFNEYYTAAQCKTTAAANWECKTDTDEKYQYVMVRTIGATDFALSDMEVYTTDRKPYANIARNKNITFSNNYVTRTADYLFSGGGINFSYIEGATVTHNEIEEIPYSGIMCGWGWVALCKGSKDNIIAYNHIKNTNQYLHDGSPIYTLGWQPNSFVTNNYIQGSGSSQQGLYPDEGSSFMEWSNNIIENAPNSFNLWMSAIREDKVIDNYAWSKYYVNDSDISTIFEPPTVFLSGDYNEHMQSIADNAGLEEQYKHIKDLVYEADIHLYDEVDNYRNSRDHGIISQISSKFMDIVKNHVDNGSFGYLPGQYAPETYYELKDMLQYEAKPDSGYEEYAIIKMRDAVKKAADNLYKVTTEELVKIANEELENAQLYKNGKEKLGYYSEQKAKALKDVLAKQQYEKLKGAYLDFALSKQTNDLLYVYMPDAKEVVIDKDNKMVTATMYSNVPLNSVTAEVMADSGAECAYKGSTWDLTKEAVIPIVCKATGEYSYWKLVAKHEQAEKVNTLDKNNWVTLAKESDTIMTTAGGGKYLTESSMLKMNSALAGEKLSINFTPVSLTEQNQFTIVFGANSPYAEVFGRTSKSDRFELEVITDKATLYKYQNGTKTKISDGDIPVKYNGENTLEIELSPNKSGTHIDLVLNGEKFISAISARTCSGGYAGFFNEKLGIKLY